MRDQQLLFYKNKHTGTVLHSYEKIKDRNFELLEIRICDSTTKAHNPVILEDDEHFLIIVGEIPHTNAADNLILNILIISEEGIINFDTKEKSEKGFSTVIKFKLADKPKGNFTVYVICNKHEVFKKLFNFSKVSETEVPAIMYYNEESKKYIVRFPDYPDCVGVSEDKQDAYENARKSLEINMYLEEYRNAEITDFQEIKKSHPAAFLVKIKIPKI